MPQRPSSVTTPAAGAPMDWARAARASSVPRAGPGPSPRGLVHVAWDIENCHLGLLHTETAKPGGEVRCAGSVALPPLLPAYIKAHDRCFVSPCACFSPSTPSMSLLPLSPSLLQPDDGSVDVAALVRELKSELVRLNLCHRDDRVDIQ